MNKRGRKSTYTPEIADEICDRLGQGESLRSICRSEGMPPPSTVRWWVVDDVNGFAAQYARSRDFGLDEMAEEIIDIADTRTDGHDDVGHRRLQIDARKWILCKLAPRRYGDRTAADLNVTSGDAQIGDTERLAKIAAVVVAAQTAQSKAEQNGAANEACNWAPSPARGISR